MYNEQGVKPIEIGRLQSHASTDAINSNKNLFQLLPENGSSVAIIGAGPAGLACACELRLLGYSVNIFEAKSKPSGLALHGTAPYKILNQDVLDEVEYLQNQFGYKISCESNIDTREKVNRLEKEYDAIFIGIGLGNTRETNTPGEHLSNCVGATEYIEQLKLNPFSIKTGANVIVIGGGNTAMDAASESARLGAEATLIYRRSKEEMGAYEFEYDLIRSVGAKAIFNASVIEIIGDHSVEKVRCIRTKNANGKLEKNGWHRIYSSMRLSN